MLVQKALGSYWCMIMPGLSGYSVQFLDDNGIDALTFPKLESN